MFFIGEWWIVIVWYNYIGKIILELNMVLILIKFIGVLIIRWELKGVFIKGEIVGMKFFDCMWRRLN